MKQTVFALSCVVCACWASTSQAGLSLVSAVGGQPANGVSYINFDDPLPAGVSLATAGGGAVVIVPPANVQYAPPVVSNGNGALFGNPDGTDASKFVTTGIGSATLTFTTPQQYLGLLWGSVDKYNTLTFYDSSDSVIDVPITGGMVTPGATGDRGTDGTFYVNINSTVGFTKVVATSSEYAFEFDNVAYGPNMIPEASALSIWGILSLGGLSWARRKRLA
ncbi:MAG: hypothetical protein U0795_02405 [Pirellulales bacterium]